MSDVTFSLTGATIRILDDGNWPNDNPSAWAIVDSSPKQKIGKGYRYTVTLPVEDAADLADYLWSAWQVNLEGEGRDSNIARNTCKAVASIEEAIKS